VTLLLLPWNAGADGKYGTGDDKVGYGHYVTGAGGGKNAAGKGINVFSYVDPADGKSYSTIWTTVGGFPAIHYRGGTWIVHGFVSVSPKQRTKEQKVDEATVSTRGGTVLLSWDTTTVEDGVYLLSFYGYDDAGNVARSAIPVEVDNHFDVCPGDPGLFDTDGDYIKDPCDNCQNDPNFDQADYDYDGEGDVCDLDDDEDGVVDSSDCVPLDETLWSVPGEALDLGIGANGVTFSWAAPANPGGTVPLVYDLLRSPLADDFTVPAECAVFGHPDSSFDDTAEPLPGEILHWLVRGRNTCGTGTLGDDSDALERPGRICP